MDLPDAVAMGHELLREHHLTGWTVVLDNAQARFGVCRFHQRQIGLSRRLTFLSDEAEVRNTVLHEIAHALVGPEHGHGDVWKAQARAIGCDARRTDQVPPGAQGPWEGRCPAGHTIARHRRPRRVGSCRMCSGGEFELSAVYVWTFHGRPAPMLPAYEAELARLRWRFGIPSGGAGSGSVLPW